MLRPILGVCLVIAVGSIVLPAQAPAPPKSSNAPGPRPLPEQTRAAVTHDVIHAWRSLAAALEDNRADLLDGDFTGTAQERLSETIRHQIALRLSTSYKNIAHDVQIVFYSPEGLSIEVIDRVEYDVSLVAHRTVKTTQHVRTRYVIVLTPAEVRWKVRFLEAVTE